LSRPGHRDSTRIAFRDMMEVDSDNALQLLRLLAQGEEVHEYVC
jgi:hypothetical protein